MSGQRGFTLVELVVAVGILALIATGIALSLTLRPGALRAATDGYDASFAAAQAIAATSGNGATVVFAPRFDPAHERVPGFTLTIYRGRPNPTEAVTPANVMQLASDADVRESTLGSPPFTIFLSTAGHPSGMPAYPKFDAAGATSFAVVAVQPPCPAGGFTLAFTTPSASQTRRLACQITAVGTPIPTPTMSPSPIILTPSSLVFEYPSAPRAHFVATEWGYPRWFAASSWTCGNGVAIFPDRTPAVPYTPPNAPADASALPLPPNDEPYSFANATDSMEDAPAWFFLDPSAGGVCATTIADAYDQSAGVAVRVMGALTAVPNTLSWPNPMQGHVQNVTLGKTYDSQPLVARITASTCANIVNVAWRPGSTPSKPGVMPSTQILAVTPVPSTKANAGGICTISVVSQYAGEPAATIGVNVRPSRGPCANGATVAIGATCTFSVPDGFDDSVCDPDAGTIGGVDTTYTAEIRSGRSSGSLGGQPPNYTFTRTATGSVSVFLREVQTTYYVRSSPSGPVCQMHSAITTTLLFTLN